MRHSVRFGLNFGSVIEEHGDVFGLTVNAAARIAAKARSGQVLLSDAVRAQVDVPTYTFIDRGLFWLKGLREQWRLFEATDGDLAEPPRPLEGRTPFVGASVSKHRCAKGSAREAEVKAGWSSSPGTLVSGRRRLVVEVGTEAEATGFQFVAARCDPVGKSDPYLPVRRNPRRIPSEDARRTVPRLSRRRRRCDRAAPPSRPPYVRRHPATGQHAAREERRYLFGAVVEVLANLARIRPMVIMLDDVHWADEHSLLLLEFLAVRLPDLPIFVAATFTRVTNPFPQAYATHSYDCSGASSCDRSSSTISHRQTSRRCSARSPEAPPPPDVVNVLYQATQGNPFFLGEVIRQLADEGLLVSGGGWRTLRPRDIDVPESVRLTIEKRLESLHDGHASDPYHGRSARARPSVSSCSNRCGSSRRTIWSTRLDEAERTHLITSSVDGDSVRFAFAHDLIRRTLDDEITLVNRQRLHARLADALEKGQRDRLLEEHAAAIAYHLENAGRWADPDRTIRFLVMAGERALEAAAYAEAIAHFEHARERLGDDAIATRGTRARRVGDGRAQSRPPRRRASTGGAKLLTPWRNTATRSAVARLCLSAAIQVALWRRGDQTMRLVDRGLLALQDRPSAYRAGFCALAGQLASQAGRLRPPRRTRSGEAMIDVARGTR